jgi:hypothetical protein
LLIYKQLNTVKVESNGQAEAALPPVRKPKTCFKFPLDGRAVIANLQTNTSRRRISNLVIHVLLKDLPSSKVPDPRAKHQKMRITRNILLKLFGNVQRSKVGLMPTK